MDHHAAIIRFLRARHDWTQDQLAGRIPCSREQVARHESGAGGLRPRTAARYAAAFGLTLQQFLHLCRVGLEGVGDVLGDDAPTDTSRPPDQRGLPFFPAGIPAGDKRFFRPGEIHSEHALPRVVSDALRLPYAGVYACRVDGDSMEPTIRAGDVILLSSQPVQEDGVRSGMIYALWYNDHLESSGQLKRLKILADGQWLAQSDNPRYPPRTIQPSTLAGMDMYLGTIGLTGPPPPPPEVSAPHLEGSQTTPERPGAPLRGPAPAPTAPPPELPGASAEVKEAQPKRPGAPAAALRAANGGMGPIRRADQVRPALQRIKKKR